LRLIIICNKNEYVKDFPTEQEIGSVIYVSAIENLKGESPSFLKEYNFQRCKPIDILMNFVPYILYDMDNHIVVRPYRSSIDDVEFMIEHTGKKMKKWHN